jgi:hypothetical protein
MACQRAAPGTKQKYDPRLGMVRLEASGHQAREKIEGRNQIGREIQEQKIASRANWMV